MTETVDAARADWQAARTAVASFPSFAEAIEPGQVQPPEDWFHDLASLEIREAEARHLLQRAELAAAPDPEGSWPLSVVHSAVLSAARELLADPRAASVLTGRAEASLALYGDDQDELLDMADRHRIEFMTAVAGVRAALPAASEQEQHEAGNRLLDMIGEAIDTPGQRVTPPASEVHFRRCAFARCKRGADGGPALFAPDASHASQRFCHSACRQGDWRDQVKAGKKM